MVNNRLKKITSIFSGSCNKLNQAAHKGLAESKIQIYINKGIRGRIHKQTYFIYFNCKEYNCLSYRCIHIVL